MEASLFALSLAVCLAGLALVMLTNFTPPRADTVSDWYVTTSGVLVVAAGCRDRRSLAWRLAAVACCGAAAYIGAALVFRLDPAATLKPFVKGWIAVMAVCAIALQFATALRCPPGGERGEQMRVAYFALALIVLPLASSWLVNITVLIPDTYDASVLRLENAFGPRIPAILRSYAQDHALFGALVRHVYISIPIACVAHDILRGAVRSWPMTKLLLISSATGFVLYFVVPVAGTTYLVPHFNDLGAAAQIVPGLTPPANTPRNCMPSLHSTWGLFFLMAALVEARVSAWRAVLAALFAGYGVCTILGALIYGDHYLLDIVVAVPFATAFYAALRGRDVMTRDGRLACVGAGVALTTAWIGLILTDAAFELPLVVVQVLTVLSVGCGVGFALSCAPASRPLRTGAA